MDLGKIVLGGMEWTGLAQDSNKWGDFVDTLMNVRVS
jgi:hypothetical protein